MNPVEKEKQNENAVHSEKGWFERPANINLLIYILVGVCALLVVAEAAYENTHMHFEKTESIIGFQCVFGFVAFVVVVFLGTALRFIVKREEDYYDK